MQGGSRYREHFQRIVSISRSLTNVFICAPIFSARLSPDLLRRLSLLFATCYYFQLSNQSFSLLLISFVTGIEKA